MNPEIHSIVKEMMDKAPANFIHTDPDPQSYHLARLAKLLALLAEEAEANVKKTENATKRIEFLSWVIAILTAVLVLTVFFEFPKTTVNFPQATERLIVKETKDKNDKNVQTLPERGHHVPNVIAK